MKRSLFLTFLMLLLTFGFATAANRIVVPDFGDFNGGSELNNAGLTGATVGFQFENDAIIIGFSNGMVVSATGNVTATIVNGSGNYVAGSRFEPIFNSQGMPWNWYYAATDDTIGFGGAWTPPATFPGFDPGPLVDAGYFDIDITLTGSGPEDNVGEICVDSTIKFGPAGDWLWDGWDGVSSPPVVIALNPTFNDGNGPTCIPVVFVPCQAPAFTTTPPGDVLTVPHCNGGSFQFVASAVEPGASITGYAVVDDGGLTASINGSGLFTVGAADPGDYTVTVSVSNTCPATTEYTFTVSMTNAGLQYTNCPTTTLSFSQNKVININLGLDNFDCDPITETVSDPGVTNPPSVSGGIFTWDNNGDVGVWDFVVTADDGFGETAGCDIQIEVLQGAKLAVRIAKIGDPPDPFVFQGTYTYLPIILDRSSGIAIGGFDFLLAYDASALTFVSAMLGDANDCWEYFQYRTSPWGNCGNQCPSGMLELIAMAETNDGPNHPTGCDGEDGVFADGAEIAKIKFFVTDDRTYECQFVPVYWYWLDCTHNAISDWTGNDLYLASTVWGINWVNPSDPFYQLIPQDGTIDPDDFFFGPWDYCFENPDPNKPTPIADIDFFNGGVDIACADEIDLRGDLNLNGLANEIADAVLYTNYFIQGPPVFIINMQGQIAASDVNNDGRVLTVGDLVYLIRILTGDAVPFEKLSPFASEATVRVAGDVVSVDAGVDIGAALFVFKGEGEVSLLAENMEMVSDVVDGETRALVWSRSTESIEAGLTDVLQVNGDISLTEVEASDYYGNMVAANVVAKVVPKAYRLGQNYPNPFNPTTEVAFDLPTSFNWTFDVYNIAGQLVKSFSDYSDAGIVKVNIDASGWASGIYFYRLQANDFVSTKKMVLMK
jgi:hypothetical protein